MGKIFNFFSGTNNRSGKGITKKQVEFDKKLGLGFFFRLMKMRLGKLSGTNLIFSLCNFFAFVALFGVSGILDSSVPTASNPLYAQIYGIMQYDQSPLVASLHGVFCVTTDLRVISTASEVLMYSALLLVFTFGLSTIGMVYNMRNICTGDYIETWNDFFYAIKRNFKQGFILGIADFIIICVLVYDIIAYSANTANSFMMLVFFFASIAFAAIYYIMRFYMYIQLVTCDMSIWKMFKNSFLLTALGFKRNFVGLICAILFAVFLFYAFLLLPQFSFILMCMFAFSFLTYLGVYCAYPVVKKYVIDPYDEDHPDERPEDPWSSDEAVFIDRG